jgi:peptide-methionine (R)-S-oxide reductase
MLNSKNVISFSLNGNQKADRRVEKTEFKWCELLISEQFRITSIIGTEALHSGALCSICEAGEYNCVCCDTPLFDAIIKVESRTGWPSFT